MYLVCILPRKNSAKKGGKCAVYDPILGVCQTHVACEFDALGGVGWPGENGEQPL